MLLIEKEWAFHLHLHNSFTDDSMVMKVDIHDFARMFASLSEYFQRDQIEIWLYIISKHICNEKKRSIQVKRIINSK